MTRGKSLAIASAVLLAVVSATVALALNAGFVRDSAAGVNPVDVPVTTTTTYEQYLAEYYAQNPATTAPAPTPSTTLAPEPVIVYEYVDVPVTVPPPQIVYVPVPAPTTTAATSPSPTTTTGSNPATSSPDSTTTGPPTTTAPSAMELLEFDFYGFADITVASHGPGESLQFWQIEQDSPWVWEIERDNGSSVEVKFFNTSTEKEAKFELQIRGEGYRIKTEGDGLPEREENL